MKSHIYNTVHDLMSKFLYYDRKEDNDLQIGEIEEQIIKNPEILEDILVIVRRSIERSVASYKIHNRV